MQVYHFVQIHCSDHLCLRMLCFNKTFFKKKTKHQAYLLQVTNALLLFVSRQLFCLCPNISRERAYLRPPRKSTLP